MRISVVAYEELLKHNFLKFIIIYNNRLILRKYYYGKYADCLIDIDTETSKVSIVWLPVPKKDANNFHDIETLIAGNHNVMLEIPVLESELQQIATILALK